VWWTIGYTISTAIKKWVENLQPSGVKFDLWSKTMAFNVSPQIGSKRVPRDGYLLFVCDPKLMKLIKARCACVIAQLPWFGRWACRARPTGWPCCWSSRVWPRRCGARSLVLKLIHNTTHSLSMSLAGSASRCGKLGQLTRAESWGVLCNKNEKVDVQRVNIFAKAWFIIERRPDRVCVCVCNSRSERGLINYVAFPSTSFRVQTANKSPERAWISCTSVYLKGAHGGVIETWQRLVLRPKCKQITLHLVMPNLFGPFTTKIVHILLFERRDS